MIIHPPNHRELQDAIDKAAAAFLKSDSSYARTLFHDHLKALHEIQLIALSRMNYPLISLPGQKGPE